MVATARSRISIIAAALTALSLATAVPAAADTDHRVEPGDTVTALAARYGTTVAAIRAANGLDARATIYIGRTVTIPTVERPAPDASAAGSYVVREGDTVWSIARRHGTSVDRIITDNRLGTGALIRIGQTLTVAGAGGASADSGPAPASSPSTTAYTVRAGDTLSRIAARHGTTVAELATANGIGDPSLIRIGQDLQVPGDAQPTGLVGDTFLGRTYPEDVVAAANRNKAALLARDVPSRAHMQALVVSTAQRLGVDPRLAQAVALQESGFNMRAVSPANAIGVMQVIPTSGEWASGMAGRHLDLLDPEDNVEAGVLILRSLTGTFDRLDHAIGGYYQGAAAVKRHGLYDDTEDYVRSVTALMGRF